MRRRSRLHWWLAALLLCTASLTQAQNVDFVQLYERGKLLLRQKLYVDAIKELKKASYTTRGQSHFGVYYYLAVAYYKLSSIQESSRYVKIARKLVKNPRQKRALNKLSRKLKGLYGSFKITPEVDPDEVGRLKLSLTPKAAFSNKYKASFYRRLAKRLRTQGIVPNNRTVFLPKGEYDMKILKPQCLKYSLVQGQQKTSTLTVADSTVQFTLRAGASCKCTGGQTLVQKGKELSCACKAGTGWNKKTQQCETGVNPVPWVLLGIGAAAAIGVGTTIIVLLLTDQGIDRAQAVGQSGEGVWK